MSSPTCPVVQAEPLFVVCNITFIGDSEDPFGFSRSFAVQEAQSTKEKKEILGGNGFSGTYSVVVTALSTPTVALVSNDPTAADTDYPATTSNTGGIITFNQPGSAGWEGPTPASTTLPPNDTSMITSDSPTSVTEVFTTTTNYAPPAPTSSSATLSTTSAQISTTGNTVVSSTTSASSDIPSTTRTDDNSNPAGAAPGHTTEASNSTIIGIAVGATAAALLLGGILAAIVYVVKKKKTASEDGYDGEWWGDWSNTNRSLPPPGNRSNTRRGGYGERDEMREVEEQLRETPA